MEKPESQFGSAAMRQHRKRSQLCKRCVASVRRKSCADSLDNALKVVCAFGTTEISPAHSTPVFRYFRFYQQLLEARTTSTAHNQSLAVSRQCRRVPYGDNAV